jgi:peptidoglycan hydrolase-like protein with peptidoglycan-binding domain
MKLWRTSAQALIGTALLVCAVAFAQSSQTASAKTSSNAKKSPTTKAHTGSTKRTSHKGKKSKSSWRRGQQKVDPARSREIQEALIREHYLNGNASGKWDAATEDAMRRFQADHGWQNKTVPDSRALIKLGLGPNHDHLLNPESAMTTAPAGPTTPGQTPSRQVDPAAAPNQPRP